MNTDRQIEWRLFCPRCLAQQPALRFEGSAKQSLSTRCEACNKPFVIESGASGSGMPICHTIPVAVRAPELVADTKPFVHPVRR